MRILFLDVDGVLNTPSNWAVRGTYDHADMPEWDWPGVHARCIGYLNQITTATDASLVMSSTWRIGTEERFQRLTHDFNAIAGVKAKFIGRTPPSIWKPRGHDIQRWLDQYPGEVESFCILDDNSDMAHLADRLVQTSYLVGLQQCDVDRAIELLGTPVV